MATKKCSSCEKTLSVDEFTFRSDRPTVRYGVCKTCRSERGKNYYAQNKEQHQRVVSKRYREFGRFKRYGLTPVQYDQLWSSQGGCCALCGAAKPGGKGKWHIDHCHGSQQYLGFPRKGFNQCESVDVRGLLCHRCNIALGHYEKLVARVGHARVGEYLNAPNAPQPPSPS